MTRAATPRSQAERGATALQVLRGTGVFLGGAIAARGLGMVGKALIARDFTVHEFGLLAMGLSILGLLQPLALAGMATGLPRLMGFHRGRGEPGRVRDVVTAALAAGAVLGVGLGAALFLSAGVLAGMAQAPQLAPVARVFALALPFTTLNTVILASYRGMGRARENVLFEQLLANVLKFGFVLLVIVLGRPFLQAVMAYALSSALETAALVAYSLPRVRGVRRARVRWAAVRELTTFSFPLFGSDALNAGARQGSALLLGFFLAPAVAGLYSAAVLLVSGVSMLYGAMRFMFLPVSSRLVGDGDHEGLGLLYNTVKRWVSAVTFPVAGTVIVLARPLLEGVFGAPYAQVALPLQLLAVAQFITVWVGPNGATLVAAGHPRPLFQAVAASNVAAVLLAAVLIPTLGLTGAALASAGSSALASALISYRLYQNTALQPVSPGFARATLAMAAGLAVASGAYWLLGDAPPALALLVVFGVLTAFSLGGLLWFDGVDGTDRVVMATVQARVRRLLPGRKALT